MLQRICACPCREPLPEDAPARQIYRYPEECRKRRQRYENAIGTPEWFWAQLGRIRRPARRRPSRPASKAHVAA